MTATPYWVTKQLAIVPRPEGGVRLDEEMVALRKAGIDVVVSMLETREAAMLGLEFEGEAAERVGIVFVNFPVPDRRVPLERAAFERFLEGLEDYLRAGKRVGVHCRACIGRSSVTIASLMIRSGVSPENVWPKISVARGFVVPDTYEQREWVEQNVSSIA